MLKCWPLSYAQQMFPCHLLKLRCLDTLREREEERVRESYSPRRHCLTGLRLATEFRDCPSSYSALSCLKVPRNDDHAGGTVLVGHPDRFNENLLLFSYLGLPFKYLGA